jgi:hypothetical protein
MANKLIFSVYQPIAGRYILERPSLVALVILIKRLADSIFAVT